MKSVPRRHESGCRRSIIYLLFFPNELFPLRRNPMA